MIVIAFHRSAQTCGNRSSPILGLIVWHDVAQATVIRQSLLCAAKGSRSACGTSEDLSAIM